MLLYLELLTPSYHLGGFTIELHRWGFIRRMNSFWSAGLCQMSVCVASLRAALTSILVRLIVDCSCVTRNVCVSQNCVSTVSTESLASVAFAANRTECVISILPYKVRTRHFRLSAFSFQTIINIKLYSYTHYLPSSSNCEHISWFKCELVWASACC